MKMRRIMIAAPKSGSGKTTIVCAMLQALKTTGEKVVSYKCGPDYIDPLFHQKAMGIPSYNLDTFFTGEAETKRLFLKNRTGDEFAVLEGVMGLYDGLGGIREEGSSYHLAKVTNTPIILVVDAKGMGRSVIPLTAGFLQYDTEGLIQGVLFNRMSRSYYEILKPLVEKELHLCAVGYFPEGREWSIESRHLGLCLPDELMDLRERLQAAAAQLRETVSVEKLLRIAEGAPELESCAETFSPSPGRRYGGEESPVIAVARDEAFCFYYEDNLELLRKFGAEIRYFSPLHDKELPVGCTGLLLGGGYPELYAKELSENKKLLAEIKKAADMGMPVVAECGGFLYAHAQLQDKDGGIFAMAGLLPGRCRYVGRSVRFGYIELEEKRSCFLPEGAKIRGHEFHYFESEDNGEDCIARKPATGKTYPCVVARENLWMGFPHLYYPSNPEFPKSFVKKAYDFKREGRVDPVENSHRFFENSDCKYFPCHKGLKDFNCLFCYCPLYHRDPCPGNPKFLEREGRRIKVCTDCIFPHRPENYDAVVEMLKGKMEGEGKSGTMQ